MNRTLELSRRVSAFTALERIPSCLFGLTKSFFICLIALTLSQVVTAKPINSTQAMRNAMAFLQEKGISVAPNGMRRAPSANNAGELAPYYVFNLGDDKGFVIASGDDRAYPVLAYSDTGSMRLDSLPDNVKCWLDFYEAQINTLKGSEAAPPGPRHAPTTVVEPMLTSKWNQCPPYNSSCPTNKYGNWCVTGCVATAMAQVLYYHRMYSTRQVMADIPGYEYYDDDESFGTVNAVPKGSVIDWDNMIDEYSHGNYTEEQAMAVANLMLYCGIADRMTYGTFASYSPGPSAWTFVEYFDYSDDAKNERRWEYTDAEWEGMVYEELAKGNPIPYSSGGHAFVLDGCDADGFVHVNWGWGGEKDGYFLLTAKGYEEELYGYTEDQKAVFGARPNGGFPRLTTQSLELNGASMVEGLSSMTTFPVSFTMTVVNLTDSENTFEQAIALYKNGKQQCIVQTLDNISNMAVNGSRTVNVSVNLDATLDDGIYQLRPLSRASGADKWRWNGEYDKFLTLAIHNGEVKIVVGTPPVEGDVITFADSKVKRLCVENWDINGDGELSRQEAAAVTSLNGVFENKDIYSFDELQYFMGLTSIEGQAFYSCNYLSSVIIPPNVVSIGEEAFSSVSLKKIMIPASIREIGRNAFNVNSYLEDIIVEDGNPCYDSRDNCHALIEKASNTLLTGCKNTIIPNGITAIGERAFINCYDLTAISIPQSVSSIGIHAFGFCYNLRSVNIPEGVTEIGEYAFCYCKALTSITLPKNLHTLGERAFYSCKALASITLPKNLRTLGGQAFAECENLKSIRVDAGNPYFDSRNNCNAVMETATNKLVAGCQNTIIPSSTESIGDYAFYGCRHLASVIIPPKVTAIGNRAFSDCNAVCRMELPEGLETIGEYAFYSMDNLTTVILPSTLTSIGKYAFGWCENLASVEARMENPIGIDNYTFYSTGIATLYVPQGSASRYRSANEWKKFKKIVEGSIPYRDIIDFADMDVKHICINHWDTNGDRELTKEEAAAVKDLGDAFTQNSPLAVEEGYAEPNDYHPRYFNELQYFTGLTDIGESAFEWSDSLKSITLPPNLQSIGDWAFYCCEKLQSIDIPESVTVIGNAFEYCRSLASVVIPQGVTKIGDYAFDGCYALTTVVVKRPEPLPIDKWTFSNYTGATLYVPKGSRNAYMNAENWKLFGKIVELTDVRGDVNLDGKVTVTDVTMLVDIALGKSEPVLLELADMNGDGSITVTDVTTLVNLILNTL